MFLTFWVFTSFWFVSARGVWRPFSSSLLHAIIACNYLPFFKIFPNFACFCSNFQIFCPFFAFFLPFF